MPLLVAILVAALIWPGFTWLLRHRVPRWLAIVVSVIGTFALIYALGFTLNTMTLMALSLSIGILIDDAIVVLDHGRVAGVGTHSELVTSTPLYRDLAKHQLLV